MALFISLGSEAILLNFLASLLQQVVTIQLGEIQEPEHSSNSMVLNFHGIEDGRHLSTSTRANFQSTVLQLAGIP